ncbi:MAG: lauroyl acyltransferase [Pseudomonadota bacterium]
MGTSSGDWREFIQNAAIRGILGVVLRVPYRWRIPLMGWIVSRVVSPLAGWPKRIEHNLRHVLPDMPFSERQRLIRQVPDNAGRTLIEIYSGTEFVGAVKDTLISGPGVAPFEAARAEGRPVILVTAHFGNYDVARAALNARGHSLAGLYRRMRNARFNDHYVRAVETIGKPVFPTDRRGLMGLIKHLKSGGVIGILVDVFATDGAPLTFFGQPAPTALSAAEWALKFDALMVPTYGIRHADGLSFEVVMDAPIDPDTPETMTQALNDSLEAHVRAHMGQWFWIHRRWQAKY